MNHKQLLKLIGIFGLFAVIIMFAVSPGAVGAQEPADSETAQAAPPIILPLGTEFTYQGFLSNADGPVTGVCDMTFQLFIGLLNQPSPIQYQPLSSPQIAEDVAVTEGIFSVVLDFDDSFGNSARWLQIIVNCGGGAINLGLQPVYAVPTALYAKNIPSTNVQNTSSGWSFINTLGVGLRARAGDGNTPDIVLAGNGSGLTEDNGIIASDLNYDSSDIVLQSNDTILFDLDNNNDGEDADFTIRDGNDQTRFNVDATSGLTTVQVLAITGGSDLSEQFNVHSDRPGLQSIPGMVVSIDPDHPGELVISNQAYDRTVAGIVSGGGDVKPGMLMSQAGTLADGQHPVALTGRVYAWADASAEPIAPGDLLTTADLPGHAMKVTDYERAQGAIIGKAMSTLDDGQGLVLVLVTLQ